jgi:DNA-binding IscR family transcriptional regulator
MFKEERTIAYAIDILKALADNPGQHDSGSIFKLCDEISTESYMRKVLQKLSKSGLVVSSNEGYMLAKSVDKINLRDLLGILPDSLESKINPLEVIIKESVAGVSLPELWKAQ